MTVQSLTLHASCVAVEGRAVLIKGPSGSGKSGLALQLMALGADLIADDRTIVTANSGVLTASAPQALGGLIEARGVGILTAAHIDAAPLHLVVDLLQTERARLPQQHSVSMLDIALPCLHKVDAPYFPAALHAYLRGDRIETE